MTTVAPPAVLLELPFPPAELSPNARVETETGKALNRYIKARYVRDYRNACRVLSLNERRRLERAEGRAFPLPVPATIILTFVLVQRQRRDFDNLLGSFKPGLDGIVDAGVLQDDNVWALRIGLEVEQGKVQAVRARIEALG